MTEILTALPDPSPELAQRARLEALEPAWQAELAMAQEAYRVANRETRTLFAVPGGQQCSRQWREQWERAAEDEFLAQRALARLTRELDEATTYRRLRAH